ncbi:hypothetical protein [Pengzhenrongella frigida]|uniref:AbiEi antitoxin C-terminal domain-containing protein n=1 Tax=Pengzhenrongella frigida TaxID=1259133 RepID=A0A4Q5N3N6_9MICO|nr:hypothetical protein [Cellulomonas sp. HLT2-17]RYV52849.1 hypothetical protein EUA98_01215 [Cellulomonas sp. HLT2-17]
MDRTVIGETARGSTALGPGAPNQTVPNNTALAWISRPPPAVPEWFDLREIGPVLWQTLLRDGLATHVWGDLAVPADRPPTPQIRARAVRGLVPPRGAVGRASAVWLHTGGVQPGRIDVLVAPQARRPGPHPLRSPHECVLPAEDVVVVGSLRVTTVERTAIDVARWVGEPGELIERLVRLADLDPARALDRLDALSGHRGVAEARTALQAALRDVRGR